MNLTAKMVAYFIIVVLVASAGFAYTVWAVNGVAQVIGQVNKVDLPQMMRVSKANMNVSDQVAFLRGYLLTKDPQVLSDYKKTAEDSTKLENDFLNTTKNADAKRMMTEAKALDDKYSEIAEKKFIPLVQAGNQEEAMRVVQQELTPTGKALNAKFDEVQAFTDKRISESLQGAIDSASGAQTAAIVAALFSAFLGIIIGFFAARSISRPVNRIAAVAEKVANADLTEKVSVDRQDEIGQMAASFNTMIDKLQTLVKKIHADAEQVAASAEELTANSEQSAQAATQVSTSITEMAAGATEVLNASNEASAVVEEMSAGIQQVAANAAQVSGQSAQAAERAKEGDKTVEQAVSQMTHIESTVNTSAQVVAKLGERSKEIGQIVDTISGIAGQTNLLALNAAIEAARAGEQGRGFAVVAEEVRKLAEQSQDAAKKIAELIGEIQGDTDKAVVAMNEGTREVKTGAEAVKAAGVAFREIVEMVSQVSGQVREASAATQQIAAGSQQIVNSVKKIDGLSKTAAGEAQSVSAATEEQLASTEEIATSSQALAQLAQDLQQEVARFRM